MCPWNSRDISRGGGVLLSMSSLNAVDDLAPVNLSFSLSTSLIYRKARGLITGPVVGCKHDAIRVWPYAASHMLKQCVAKLTAPSVILVAMDLDRYGCSDKMHPASFEEDNHSMLVKYGFVIFFNVTMWGCYVNSLKALPSLQATVTNFATNFLSSGLAGFFLFGEPLSSRWFAGALLIVLGVFVLSKSSIEKKPSSD
ncbi:hypothetical protein MRB53_000954 [Persea americana]|uniref:Uncharacterized protein n=1 Tax=Persea americana TaxID=3435 RepID=A0ACC2MR88_PERAE|nr:hypothetical protein MRB53_000954 [Persea americana]